MAGRISLAQQIALLSETAPTDFDPEHLHPENVPSDNEGPSTAARAHYVDVGPSTLRQINQASISDQKYEGKRISRKQLSDDEDEDIPSQSTESDDGPPEGSESEEEDGDGDVEQQSGSEDETSVPSRVRFVEPPLPQPESPVPRKSFKRPPEEVSEPPENQDFASTLRATREQDRKKGKAATQQISLWDTLLDARIRLQKAASAVNRLPPDTADEPTVKDSLHAMLDEAISLSEDLFTLQETLLRVDGSAIPLRKRAKTSHEGDRDYTQELTALSSTASEREAAYHPYLIQTLKKWSAKVQAVAPGVLLPSNRGSFKNAMSGKAGAPGVVDVIDDTLRTDAAKLLARTRQSRGRDEQDGASDDEHGPEANAEVFDDTDFYQQLLRDVIEARGGGNGEGDEQEWVRRQKARKAKRKKTVDTKASKGRKVRYQVHEKLQNFMVPVPAARGAWHEEQIDELFTSLLSSAR